MSNGEQTISSNGAEICFETFGAQTDPAVLLIHGACASMLWWEAELCALIAARGRFVIRYDNRDTGRSTTYPPGEPGYSLNNMVEDALAILDALGLERVHVVGRSMGAAIATALAVDHADRVSTLTLVTASTGDDDLPEMSAEFVGHTSTNPDFDDDEEVVEYITGLMRVFSGGSPYFDENEMRALACQDVARAVRMASTLTNHFRVDFDAPKRGGPADVAVPALVVHGERDPVFPLPHGEALRDAIGGARLLVLPKAGHEVPKELWPLFIANLVEHTARQCSTAV
jgi:pimeloyl-ACP methyl ester carboxylesterase